MIRAQAIADHEKTTGHNGFRGTTDETGRVVCTQCPWQYPPEPKPVETAEQHRDRTGHTVWIPADPAEPDNCTVCAWPDYDVPAAAIADPPPTDPAPAMGPIEPDPGYPHAEDDCTRCQQDAAELAAETSDPRPVPAAPEVPPLTLRARIENAIDRAFGESNWEPGDKWLPDPEFVGGIVHAEVGAGADWSPREENVELTPAQALAYLLDLPEWARIARLGMLLEQARKGSDCFMRGHQDIEQELREIRQQRDRLHHAMVQIARLTATIDQPESVGQSVIGSISSEALVPE